MTAATELITEERNRQIEELGFTPEHDAEHEANDLAFAAICYAAPMPVYLNRIQEEPPESPRRGGTMQWVEPWPMSWPRPLRAESKDERVQELIKAGALIAAELDRLLETEDPE